ncbi:hypothetical protein B0H19DRAFT_1070952 [Mycena capillaripes]|nr:hypothetical protein B0H19DRAFT_1070952 [Mycena capillaripes]
MIEKQLRQPWLGAELLLSCIGFGCRRTAVKHRIEKKPSTVTKRRGRYRVWLALEVREHIQKVSYHFGGICVRTQSTRTGPSCSASRKYGKMQRTTRSTTHKGRSQSNNVPTDQRTNLRATKPKVKPKTKSKPPTRSKADSKRRVDEETEENADADVDDGDGIRDGVDEDTANAGENASKSEKIPDDVADAQLQNGTINEETPDDVADAQLQNGTENEAQSTHHDGWDTNDLLTDLAHDPFNLSRRLLGRTWRDGHAPPPIDLGDEQELAQEEEQPAAATEEQWHDPEDDRDAPYSDGMYRFPDIETMHYVDVDDEEDHPYFDLNDFPSPGLRGRGLRSHSESPSRCPKSPKSPSRRHSASPSRMDATEETRHRAPAATPRPFPVHATPPRLLLVGATNKTRRRHAAATLRPVVMDAPNHLIAVTPPHLPLMDASDKTRIRHRPAATTLRPLPVHATRGLHATQRLVARNLALLSAMPRRGPLSPQESDLSHPSDDFEVGQAAEEKARAWRKSHGMPVALALEELDQEDEEEFEKEKSKTKKSKAKGKTATTQTETEAAVETGKGGRKSRGRGKAKATQPTGGFQSDDCLVDGDEVEEEEDGNSDGKGSTRGPIPDDIKELLYQAHDEFTATVDNLAKRCGKSSTTLHEELGTVIRTGRAPSAWNVWQQYFGELIPKDKITEREANFSKQSRAAFVAACRVGDDFPKEFLSDSEAVYQRLPWLRGWKANVTENAVAALRDNNKIKAKLKSELKPVTQLAALLLSTYNVHMWGYLIDPDGQASFVFGAGEDFKEMRRLQHHNLNQQVKDQEHIFGTIEMRKRGLEALRIPIPNLDAQDGETMRDAYRRQFTSIVAGQLWEFLRRAGTLSGQDLDKTRFQMRWGVKFIDAAREGKCRIINYPTALRDANQIIGSAAFVLKKIKSATFETFMDELVKANASSSTSDGDDSVMRLVSWNDDERQLPLDEQGKIPVIIDEEGVVLLRVKHSEGFASDVKKQAETAEKEARAAQKEASKARKVKPFKARDSREVVNSLDVLAGPSRPPQRERPKERNSRARSLSPPHHVESSRPPHNELEPYDRPRSPSPHTGEFRQYYAKPDRHSRAGPSRPYYAKPDRGLRAGSSRAHYATPDRDLHAAPSPNYYPEPNRNSRPYSPAPHPEPSRFYYAKADSRPWSPPPPHAGSSYLYSGTNSRAPPSSPYPTDSHHSNQHSRSGFERPAARSAHDLLRIPDSSVPHVPNSRSRSVAVEHNTTLPRMDFVARERELSRAAQLNSRTRAPVSGGVRVGSSTKRKALHDGGAESSDREPKHRRALGEELIKMRFMVDGQQPGRIFYATRLRHTDHPSRADAYLFIEEAGRWERMDAKRTPVLATEEDSERYKKDIAILGLEDYPPQRR